MKKIQRIVSLLLAMVMLAGIAAGCGEKDEGGYISKGIFFSMFIEFSGIYPLTYTKEELGQADSFKVEAQTMVDWDLLTEEQVKNPQKAVTREIVAQACVRNMLHRTTCAVDVKDINKCEDPQAVMDAVGMGLFELENGYFDALGKVTLDQCIEVLEKYNEIEVNSHFEDGELEVEYNDNVTIVDGDQVLGIVWDDEEATSEDADTVSGEETEEPQAHWLSYRADGTEAAATQLAANGAGQCGTMTITAFEYNANRGRYKVGSVVACPSKYTSALPLPNELGYAGSNYYLTAPAAIKIERITEKGNTVELYGQKGTPKDLIKDVPEGTGINAAVCSRPSKDIKFDIVPASAELDAFGFKIRQVGNGIEVKFTHTFTLEDKIFGGSQSWRNPKATPSVEITASISDFAMDTMNVGKLLWEKEGEESFELSYKTTFDFKLKAGGLRYSPANNGNGGLKYSPDKGFSGNLFANVKNSRFTGAGAGGSNKIKLAQVVVPLGSSGFTIGMNVYFTIELDGTISFGVESNNKLGVTVKKLNRWKYVPEPFYKTNRVKNLDINANLDFGLSIDPRVDFFGTTLADSDIGLTLRIDAMAKIVEKSSSASSNYMYATKEELDEECAGSKCVYCINADLKIFAHAEALTEKSTIGKLMKKLKCSPIKTTVTLMETSCHFEDGAFVPKCTRGGSTEQNVNVNKDDSICVDLYKVNLGIGEMQQVSITSLPVSEKKIYGKENLTKQDYERRKILKGIAPGLATWVLGGIDVASEDTSVATVRFDEQEKKLYITAAGEGSTQIKITLREKNAFIRSYTQEVSITVAPSAAPVVNAAQGAEVFWMMPYFGETLTEDTSIKEI